MTNRLHLALPGLCAILGVVVLAEIIVTTPASTKVPAALSGTREDGEQAAEQADQIMAEILKRPLFTQGRQPPEEKVVKAEPPQLQGRLAGVMLRPDLREALFTRPGGRPIAVKEGQVIDGWTMAEIESDQVRLTSEFGEKIVKPSNGTADEVPAHHAAVKKAAPAQNKPAAQNQKPAQLTQAAAKTGSTGQK
jgi:hypothetical protein